MKWKLGKATKARRKGSPPLDKKGAQADTANGLDGGQIGLEASSAGKCESEKDSEVGTFEYPQSPPD